MKLLFLIVNFAFFGILYSSVRDSIRLIKVKYYYSRIYFPSSPHRKEYLLNQKEFFQESHSKQDSIIDSATLVIIDSMFKLSDVFNARLNDTFPEYYDASIGVHRGIILTYSDRKVYICDNGDWNYDWRIWSHFKERIKGKGFVIIRRKIKTKYLRINGQKTKNRKHLYKAINRLEYYLKCKWC